MKVTLYGTRGSTPVAGPQFAKYGGNTTCLRIESDCLPPETALVVDAGTGIVPLSGALLKIGIRQVWLLFTHYHHDHTQGLLLAPITFIKGIKVNVYGLVDNGQSVQNVLKTLMQPPFFPVDFAEVGSHFFCEAIQSVNAMILVIHPKGGLRLMWLDQFERLINDGQQIYFTEQARGERAYDVGECLVIKMHRSNHPERTVSYRFEERPTGKIFCFLTDHENTDALPASLRGHLKEADLLIQDSQYSRQVYEARTAGFGHGTPDYCVKVAVAVGAKRLGLTHHDPSSSDEAVDAICAAARETMGALRTEKGLALSSMSLIEGDIFACADYQTIEV